jgi:hypothetical protein
MVASSSSEALVRAQVAVHEARLARLTTQSAIERSRSCLAETRALLVALRFANRKAHRFQFIGGEAATEAKRLLAALIKIQNEST